MWPRPTPAWPAEPENPDTSRRIIHARRCARSLTRGGGHGPFFPRHRGRNYPEQEGENLYGAKYRRGGQAQAGKKAVPNLGDEPAHRTLKNKAAPFSAHTLKLKKDCLESYSPIIPMKKSLKSATAFIPSQQSTKQPNRTGCILVIKPPRPVSEVHQTVSGRRPPEK